MNKEIRVPELPESVNDATVTRWLKSPGDSVKQGELLLELETDKVALEVPAPVSGTLVSQAAGEGETVKAEQLLGELAVAENAGDCVLPPASLDESPVPAPVAAGSSNNIDEPTIKQAEAPVEQEKPEPSVEPSPSVRRLLRENSISASEITGSGKHGQITKDDVLAYIEQLKQKKEAPRQSSQPMAAVPKVEMPDTDGQRIEKRVPMTRLRARIAERLLEATQTTAMLTTFNEVNMQALINLRQQYRELFEKTHNTRLGFMSMFVRAATVALQRFPEVNASIDGNDILYHGFCDIGIAVASDRGLVVPMLRNTEHMSMAQIEASIIDYAAKARDGKLSLEDLQGGTFTITNGGVFGSLLSTPILNPPQSAILGMHVIQKRPVVENDEIVIRPMMYLALSYDHRIIDGRGAVSFLRTIKELIEEPARILLEI